MLTLTHSLWLAKSQACGHHWREKAHHTSQTESGGGVAPSKKYEMLMLQEGRNNDEVNLNRYLLSALSPLFWAIEFLQWYRECSLPHSVLELLLHEPKFHKIFCESVLSTFLSIFVFHITLNWSKELSWETHNIWTLLHVPLAHNALMWNLFFISPYSSVVWVNSCKYTLVYHSLDINCCELNCVLQKKIITSFLILCICEYDLIWK